MSPFYGARAHIFVWTRACTSIVSTMGGVATRIQSAIRLARGYAHRLLWLAPCRPPVKTIVTEHRLSKHTDCQWINWAPLWLVRQVQVGAWFGLGLKGWLPVAGSEGHWLLRLAPSHVSCTMSGYRDTISIYTDIVRCRNTISIYPDIAGMFSFDIGSFSSISGLISGGKKGGFGASSYRVSISCTIS